MAGRFQRGCLRKRRSGGRWVWLGMWWEKPGKRRSEHLGECASTPKSVAQEKLDALVRVVNQRRGRAEYTFGDFVQSVYYVWKRRSWKKSTRATTEERINRHLVNQFATMLLSALSRETLQDYLDDLATRGVSHSTLAHLRFDLRAIFEHAVNDGVLSRNPAALLCKRTAKPGRDGVTALCRDTPMSTP